MGNCKLFFFFLSKAAHQYELPMVSLNREFQAIKKKSYFTIQDDEPF